MATDASDNTAIGGYLVAHQDMTQIEEVDGRKIARFKRQPFMDGHTFVAILSDSSYDSTPPGPFRIEYVLGTEFVIHENELPSLRFEDGYSYLDRIGICIFSD
jgi:hypothetical protein